MATYSVTTRGLAPVEVQASNWMVALGLGLEQLGARVDIERLACEVLPNGTVIARETRTGTGFVIEKVLEDDEPGQLEHLALVGDALLLDDDDPFQQLLKTVRRATTRDDACERALTLAMDAIPAESGAVILRQGAYLKFMAVAGPHAPSLRGLLLPESSGVVGFCVDTRRALVLDDASADPRHFREIDELTGYRTRDLACIPVNGADEAFGVIEMLNLEPGQRFDRKRVFTLQAICEALAERLRALPT